MAPAVASLTATPPGAMRILMEAARRTLMAAGRMLMVAARPMRKAPEVSGTMAPVIRGTTTAPTAANVDDLAHHLHLQLGSPGQ